MSTNKPADWIKVAKLDLEDFDCNYEKKEFARSLYFLQQATEKTFKATTIATRFSSNSHRERSFMKMLGFPVLKPKEYEHPLREAFFNQLKETLESPIASSFVESMGIQGSSEKISLAASIKDKKNPTEKDVAGLVADCNMILDVFQSKTFKDSIDKQLDQYREVFDKLFNASLGKVTDESFRFIRTMVIGIVILVVGLILSIYLNPFETARYPRDDSIESFKPHLVEIKQIIKRCILALETSIS